MEMYVVVYDYECSFMGAFSTLKNAKEFIKHEVVSTCDVSSNFKILLCTMDDHDIDYTDLSEDKP